MNAALEKPMKTFKALAALLSYPDEALVAALPELHGVIVLEGLVDRGCRSELRAMMHAMEGTDLLDLQEAYVATFDRGRATSLHLFEHVHGDSRARGQAMVDLQAVYRDAGLHLDPRELPDYLPAMLEFLSLRPLAEAREMLAECAHLVRAIGGALRDRGGSHAAVFEALLKAAGEEGLEAAPPVPPEDEEDLDAAWAEEPAFGPAAGDAGCAAAASGRGCAPSFAPPSAIPGATPRAA
jgi:nitrate reductase delta subunit